MFSDAIIISNNWIMSNETVYIIRRNLTYVDAHKSKVKITISSSSFDIFKFWKKILCFLDDCYNIDTKI